MIIKMKLRSHLSYGYYNYFEIFEALSKLVFQADYPQKERETTSVQTDSSMSELSEFKSQNSKNSSQRDDFFKGSVTMDASFHK